MYEALMKEAPKQQTIQKKEAKSKPNHTGISDTLKEKYENQSGFSFDDVKVHYNSDKPAQLQALAYTQGNQVFVAPRQERHLEHELGHVIQQKQGIVKPTGRIKDVPINDDNSLERNADRMIQNFNLSYKKTNNENIQLKSVEVNSNNQPIQCEKILNIASGTDIDFLLPSSGEDQVLNTDRGDMIYLRFIIKNYEHFETEIMDDIMLVLLKEEANSMRLNKYRCVNYWFYSIWNGNIELLWDYITYIEKQKNISFIESESRLYDDQYLKGKKEFKFGTILDEKEITVEKNKYDIIRMTSGYMVPVLKEKEYEKKIHGLLKSQGKLEIIGNKPCLETNGISIPKEDITIQNIKYDFSTLFNLVSFEQVDVKSQHTIDNSEVSNLFHIKFQKKDK